MNKNYKRQMMISAAIAAGVAMNTLELEAQKKIEERPKRSEEESAKRIANAEAKRARRAARNARIKK